MAHIFQVRPDSHLTVQALAYQLNLLLGEHDCLYTKRQRSFVDSPSWNSLPQILTIPEVDSPEFQDALNRALLSPDLELIHPIPTKH